MNHFQDVGLYDARGRRLNIRVLGPRRSDTLDAARRPHGFGCSRANPPQPRTHNRSGSFAMAATTGFSRAIRGHQTAPKYGDYMGGFASPDEKGRTGRAIFEREARRMIDGGARTSSCRQEGIPDDACSATRPGANIAGRADRQTGRFTVVIKRPAEMAVKLKSLGGRGGCPKRIPAIRLCLAIRRKRSRSF